MVKIGFIVEGNTEKVIIDSLQFKEFLKNLGLSVVDPVLDAKGNGNLLPQNIEPFINRLQGANASQIIVITDADDNTVTQVKKRILPKKNLYKIDAIIVAVKAFEAWFLACDELMRNVLRIPDFSMEYPERTPELPFDYIKNLTAQKQVRGPGSKISFAKRVLRHGFSLQTAANHPHCPSATSFLNYLHQIAEQ